MSTGRYSLGGVYNDFYQPKPKQPETPQKQQEELNKLETTMSVQSKINKLIGLSGIKTDIDALMDFIKIQGIRKEQGLPTSGLSLHTAFIGNPGTGKTTIARLMGEYFKAIGILEKGHLVEVSRADLVADHVGGTALKTNKAIDQAMGGILFIDEAYSLSEGSDNDYGQEAINILVDRMEKDRDNLAIFFAGYSEDMQRFFESNAGLGSRVTRKFYFEDYKGSELLAIFQLIADKNGYKTDEKAGTNLQAYFDYVYYIRDQHFGNGRLVRNVFEKLIKSQANRLSRGDIDGKNLRDKELLMTITSEDVHHALDMSQALVTNEDLDSALKELDQYVGLKNIKEHIFELVNLIQTNQKRTEHGLPTKSMTYHSIFSGSPGTGKTTIARILGKVYQSLGILKKGHVIEVDRSGLVGSYVGQTEVRTTEVIDSAMDGILFVDEAYALAGGANDYGQKAIDTILKRMDDDRERLIVIVAGYTQEMQEFVDTNPGLKDRFTRHFEFKDFNADELTAIFTILSKKQELVLEPSVKDILNNYFEKLLAMQIPNFGNGRFVRNLFEEVVVCQANRLSSIQEITREDLVTITAEDIHGAIDD
jgi:SpoVK/Ycf46/Vps4 family AAA+-type ATPase